MPLDFPANPSLNDTYSFGGKTWIWNGDGWALNTSGAINDIPIGNVTASTGNFTTLSATSVTSSGNIDGANVTASAGIAAGTTVTATGNVTGGNLVTAGLVSATGNITGGNLLPPTDNTGVVGTADLTWNNGRFTDLTIDDVLTVRTAIDLADGDRLRLGTNDDWQIYHDGTSNRMDLFTRDLTIRDDNTTRFTFGRTTGDFTATGNVTGGNILGNGAGLTGINVFSNVTISGGNSIVADSISDTLTLIAGDGISLTGNATADSITIAVTGSGDSIFVTGGDMGTVEEAVTDSEDLGSVDAVVTVEIDMGTIVTSGVIYPDQLVIPTFTVATLPSVVPAAQMIYVSDESGGSVPAFSDGTNWRRVTDRAIVT